MRVWSGELVIGKNGIRFKGVTYGQHDSELLSRQGRKVRVSYDPDDMSSIHVYDAASMRLITIAQQNQFVAYGVAVKDEDLREAMRQKARARKTAKAYRDSRLTANMDLPTLAIRAQQDSVQDVDHAADAAATLRPVATPLDSQVAEHTRQRVRQQGRKAVGAESLDFDFSILQPERRKRERLFGQ